MMMYAESQQAFEVTGFGMDKGQCAMLGGVVNEGMEQRFSIEPPEPIDNDPNNQSGG